MKNPNEIKVRALQFAKAQKLIMKNFYEKIGSDPSNFSGKSLESTLSGDTIVRILTYYPELSPDWLLLEKGEMLRKNNPKNVAVASAPQANAANGDMSINAPAELLQLLSDQNRLLASQQDTIKTLSETVRNLTSK